jgi:RND family efflux transporter MFP subunit
MPIPFNDPHLRLQRTFAPLPRAAVAAAFAAALMPLAGCSQSNAAAAVRALPPPTVAVAKVQRGDVAQTLSVAAAIRPNQEIEVHAKVAGYLKSIFVDIGDRVKAGQPLAVLESPELEDDLREGAADVQRAQDEVKRAQADLDRAESVHEVAHLGADRLSSVLKAQPNLVAQQDIDESLGKDRVAEAQVATARAALAAVVGQLEVARARQMKTRTLLAYLQIAAPFSGVITRRYADPGAMIQAGISSQTQAMPLVRLSENDRVRLVIPVPESAVSHIKLGTPVTLVVDALRKTVVGQVTRFAGRLDSDTRTMPVEVDLDNRSGELAPGMYVTVSLVLEQVRNCLTVPVEALDRSGREPRVLVVTGNRSIEPRRIVIGLEAPDRVEVTRGLAEDDMVVVGPRAQLKEGAQVTPRLVSRDSGETETH